MLTPRLTNCPECADIPDLLKKIDCKLAEYANGLYNNVVFMLNQVVPAGAMIQLLAYKRILTYKQCNPDYLADFCMDKIVSKVIRLTLGCYIKPTVTETLIPTTTSTTSTSTTCPPLICSFDGTGVSSCSFTGNANKVTIPTSSTTTTTTSAIVNCCTFPTNLELPGGNILLDGVNLTFSSTKPGGLERDTSSTMRAPACLPNQILNTIFTGGFSGNTDWDYTINFDQPVNDVNIQVINYSASFDLQIQEQITFTTNTDVPEIINCDGCNVIIESNSIKCVMNTNGSGTFTVSTILPYTSLTLTPTMLGVNPQDKVVAVFLRICGLTTSTTTSTTSATPTTSTTSSTTTTTTTSIPSILICDQEWTLYNLDVSTYRDGTVIPQVTDPTAWAGLTTGAWCYYNNLSSNGTTYGKLYNWYAVAGIDGSGTPKSLAPVGYHIPTQTEWNILQTCLGGYLIAGGKMKSTGTIQAATGLWEDPNTGATNSSGFSGLPGGYRTSFGTYVYIGYEGNWWSSEELDTTYAWSRYVRNDGGYLTTLNSSKGNGFSIRLIKD